MGTPRDRASLSIHLKRFALLARTKLLMIDVTSLNVFQCCKFLRHAGRWVMFALVAAIVAGSAYATLKTALVPRMASDILLEQAGYGVLAAFYLAVVSDPKTPCYGVSFFGLMFFFHERAFFSSFFGSLSVEERAPSSISTVPLDPENTHTHWSPHSLSWKGNIVPDKMISQIVFFPRQCGPAANPWLLDVPAVNKRNSSKQTFMPTPLNQSLFVSNPLLLHSFSPLW
jgi:hypothetical protein